MTTLREAAQMALDALEEFCEHGAMLRPLERRDALRAALAQPEQEPVAWCFKESTGNLFGFTTELFDDEEQASNLVPLYTAPPQREWQRLTDEEMLDIADMAYANDLELLQTLQAKLKEKNT